MHMNLVLGGLVMNVLQEKDHQTWNMRTNWLIMK